MKTIQRMLLGRNQGGLLKRARSPYWYTFLRVHGKEIIESTGTTDLNAATDKHAERIKERVVDEAGYKPFSGPALKRLKVNHFLDALASYFITKQRKSGPKQVSHMKPVRAHFGSWPAQAVTKQAIEAYVATRRALGRSDTTINRELQILGQALRMEVRHMTLPTVPKIDRLPGEQDNARAGFFEAVDFAAVVEALPAHLQDVARFAYTTGWRKRDRRLALVSREPGQRHHHLAARRGQDQQGPHHADRGRSGAADRAALAGSRDHPRGWRHHGGRVRVPRPCRAAGRRLPEGVGDGV